MSPKPRKLPSDRAIHSVRISPALYGFLRQHQRPRESLDQVIRRLLNVRMTIGTSTTDVFQKGDSP